MEDRPQSAAARLREIRARGEKSLLQDFEERFGIFTAIWWQESGFAYTRKDVPYPDDPDEQLIFGLICGIEFDYWASRADIAPSKKDVIEIMVFHRAEIASTPVHFPNVLGPLTGRFDFLRC